ELDRSLKPLKEESRGRVQGTMNVRWRTILDGQKALSADTAKVAEEVAANPDHKPARGDVQKLVELGDRQDALLKELDKFTALWENIGLSGASANDFRRLREDMLSLSRRLRKGEADNSVLALARGLVQALETTAAGFGKSSWEPAPPKQEALL